MTEILTRAGWYKIKGWQDCTTAGCQRAGTWICPDGTARYCIRCATAAQANSSTSSHQDTRAKAEAAR